MNTEYQSLADRLAAWLSGAYRSQDSFLRTVRELDAVHGTNRGMVRSENQDRIMAARYTPPHDKTNSFILFALADGMGGMVDGAKCAELTLSVIVERLVTNSTPDLRNRVISSVLEANRRIYDLYRDKGGTTLSAIVLNSTDACAINVGDSRIYKFQLGESGSIFQQVSTDDTIAGELERLRGTLLSDSSREYFSNRLAQYIGIGEGLEPRFYDAKDISSAYGYLLTSDGAHDLFPEVLGRLVLSSPSITETVKRIIQLSLWTGGFDNASAICIKPGALNNLRHSGRESKGTLEIWNADSKLEIVLEPQKMAQFEPRVYAETKLKTKANKRGKKNRQDEPSGKTSLQQDERKQITEDETLERKHEKKQRELNIEIGSDHEDPKDSSNDRS